MHLTLIYDPTQDDAKVEPSHDVIFLHGLTGDSESTWTAPNRTKSWLETLLAPQFPHMNIWTCDWDWKKHNTITDLAGAFLKRLGNSTRRRPVFIIAHDIGCLIVAQAVLLLQEAPDDCFYVGTIARNLCGMILMDAPFGGGVSTVLRSRQQMEPEDLGISKPHALGFDDGPYPDKSYMDLWNMGHPEVRHLSLEFLNHVLELQRWDKVDGISVVCSTRAEDHRERILAWPFEPTELSWRYISSYSSHSGMTKFVDGTERSYKFIVADIRYQIYNKQFMGEFHWFFNREHLRKDNKTPEPFKNTTPGSLS